MSYPSAPRPTRPSMAKPSRYFWWRDKCGVWRYRGGQQRRRLERARRPGLPCRIQYMKSGNLHALRLDPLPGFTHMSSPRDVSTSIKSGNHYHVTIALNNRLKRGIPRRLRGTGTRIGREHWDALEFVRQAFKDPIICRLRIDSVDEWNHVARVRLAEIKKRPRVLSASVPAPMSWPPRVTGHHPSCAPRRAGRAFRRRSR